MVEIPTPIPTKDLIAIIQMNHCSEFQRDFIVTTTEELDLKYYPYLTFIKHEDDNLIKDLQTTTD